jgi:hypothetical protein
MNFKVLAIETAVADQARLHPQDALGFPTFTSAAAEGLPCRHCLQWIEPGAPATFFTLDPFAGTETLPLPGPVYIHANGCPRYAASDRLPAHLFQSPRTLNAYAKGRRLVAQEYVQGETAEKTIARLFERKDVNYVHVRSTTAGCFTFRLERD